MKYVIGPPKAKINEKTEEYLSRLKKRRLNKIYVINVLVFLKFLNDVFLSREERKVV